MISRAALAVAALLAPDAVSALSCIRPDAVALYETARDSERSFMLVLGHVEPRGSVAPRDPGNLAPEPVEIPATITGMALTDEGFDWPFERRMTVTLDCLASWCGALPETDRTVLVAVDVTDPVETVAIGPCGDNAIPVEQPDVARVLACHRGGFCERLR